MPRIDHPNESDEADNSEVDAGTSVTAGTDQDKSGAEERRVNFGTKAGDLKRKAKKRQVIVDELDGEKSETEEMSGMNAGDVGKKRRVIVDGTEEMRETCEIHLEKKGKKHRMAIEIKKPLTRSQGRVPSFSKTMCHGKSLY